MEGGNHGLWLMALAIQIEAITLKNKSGDQKPLKPVG